MRGGVGDAKVSLSGFLMLRHLQPGNRALTCRRISISEFTAGRDCSHRGRLKEGKLHGGGGINSLYHHVAAV